MRALFAGFFLGSSLLKTVLSLGLQMKATDRAVAVVGCAGGAAETVACKLLGSSVLPTIVLDRSPISPVLRAAIKEAKVEVYYGDAETKLEAMDGSVRQLEQILAGKQLIVIGDDGDHGLREETPDKDKSKAAAILSTVSRKLPDSITGVVCAIDSRADSMSGIGAIFGRKISESFSEFCSKSNTPFSLLRYGQLTGGVPGNEPLPFLGMPALEPELHPSYTLRSVLITDLSSKYSDSDLCTRDSLAEACIRLLQEKPVQCRLLSIAGDTPTDKDWSLLLSRLKADSDVEILRIEFGAVLKPQAMLNWLVETWFPQALIDADAATILSGARPVRAIKTSDRSFRIMWEDITPDLSVKTTGGVEVSLTMDNVPSLVAKRLSGGSLPGEMQLMDRLIEGINKVAYKKQFCSPL